MKSWITTLGGVLTAAGGAIIGARATGLVESVPTWLMWIGIILAAAGPVILGAAARDNNKSSEDVGVKHGPPGRRPMLGSCWLLFLLPAAMLGGCVNARFSPETGELSYTRVGDQALEGVTFTKLADGSMEFTLEKQHSQGQVMTEVLLKALEKIP